MHRSGTSMLARLLESLGLFVGTKQDHNSEAIFFQQLNEWLMAQCGARWDMPGAMQYLWKNEELLNSIEDYLRCIVDSAGIVKFLGLRRYLAASRTTCLQNPWGWKDPRNTFTLPMWLRIFPEAKVIYTERHGVDVAQSLRVRSRAGFVKTTTKYRKYRPIVFLRRKHGGFVESPRCASLEGGFSLWQEYANQAEEFMQQLPNHRLLKLRYEKLIEDPVTHLRASAEFCGMDVTDRMIEARTKGVDISRAYSFLSSSELRSFARMHKRALAERGYE
jgi:hypothetical protein